MVKFLKKFYEYQYMTKFNGKNYNTDKGTTHSYMETYQHVFSPRKDTAKKVFEIGTGLYGGSVLMWRDYFPNAEIVAVDHNTWLDEPNSCFKKLIGEERIKLIHADAYKMPVVDGKWDIIIDDGSHWSSHQKRCLELYLPFLKDDGVLVIEDIDSIETLEMLYNTVPENLKPYARKVDLRANKNRYDDLMLIVDLSDQV